MTTESKWPMATLGSVTHFYAGSSLPEGEPFITQSNGYLLMRVSDMNRPGNETFLREAQFWSPSAGPKSATCPAGSLVIPKRGGAISTNKKRITTRVCVLDPNLMAITPSDKLDIRFLYHWFLTFDLASIANGSSVPQLNKKDLDPLPVPLPPIDAQRKIATVLNAADSVRAKRRSTLALLDDLAQSIFLDMFGDPAGNDGRWPKALMGDVSSVQGGIQVSAARKNLPIMVPYLRVANVHRGRLDLAEIKLMRVSEAEFRRACLAAGDLLIVEGHGNAMEIGRAAIWDGSIDPCTHQNHLIRVRPDKQVMLSDYAAAYLNSTGGRRYLLEAAKTTSGLNTISISDIRSIPIAMPPIDIQHQFSARLAKVRMQASNQQNQLDRMDSLFASLQHLAFKREL